MQSRHYLLSLITLIIAFLAVIFLNPFGEEVTSSPFALAVQETFTDQVTIRRQLLGTTDPAMDHGRFDEIEELLNRIEAGQATLSLINQYDIVVQFTSERGSRFNPNTNQIYINRSHDPVMAALILVHEVTHARFLHEGTAADFKMDGRETYVAKKVQEEATAAVGSIEAKMELEAAGLDTSGQKTALEIPYRQAYEMAIRGVSAGTSGDDDDLAQTNGRTAARQSIFDALMTGKAITSTTKQTYPMYWGEDWDKHNDAS